MRVASTVCVEVLVAGDALEEQVYGYVQRDKPLRSFFVLSHWATHERCVVADGTPKYPQTGRWYAKSDETRRASRSNRNGVEPDPLQLIEASTLAVPRGSVDGLTSHSIVSSRGAHNSCDSVWPVHAHDVVFVSPGMAHCGVHAFSL